MRVCHFSSVHHVWDTRVFYRECVSLAKKFDVTLIAIGNEGNFVKDGVRVISIPKPKNFIERFFKTVFKVFILAVKQEAHIYHIHDAEMIPFGILLSVLGKQVIYDIHENTHDDILLKPWIKPNKRKLLAKGYNALLWIGSKFLHYIVVVADPKFLPKFFVDENQATIIQNFANVDDFKPYLIEDRSKLLGNHLFYVGMIKDMYYNINPFLDAMVLLNKKGIKCHLHLVGYFGAGISTNLHELHFWEQLKDQITYYGFLETPEAYQISMQCKVGLCIKNQPESMLVSHERKLFEYLAIGLPSIFCNQSIYSGLNHQFDMGESVDVNDANAIAHSLEILLGSEEILLRKSQNAISAARQHFNWNMEEKKLIELYRYLRFN
ncbi:MAG: glycosyltransferase family 4 protein [Bacteroidia bacterium]